MTTPSKTQGITYTDYLHGAMQKATASEFLEPVEDPITPTHLRADVKPHLISSITITLFFLILRG